MDCLFLYELGKFSLICCTTETFTGLGVEIGCSTNYDRFLDKDIKTIGITVLISHFNLTLGYDID